VASAAGLLFILTWTLDLAAVVAAVTRDTRAVLAYGMVIECHVIFTFRVMGEDALKTETPPPPRISMLTSTWCPVHEE
jgi:hypothetical protein